jgi:uncharacterized protein YecE (DUF72 family)
MEILTYIIQLTKKNDLTRIVDAIIASKKVTGVYIYFNNTATEAAIKNATRLKKYICDLA